MDIFLLYLFTRLNPLHAALFIVAFLTGIGALVAVIGCVVTTFDESFEDHRKPWRALAKVIVPVFLVVGAVKVLLPTQKDAALILAGYGVIEVAKSDTAGRLASKSVQLIEQTLDGYLKKEKK